LETVLRYNLPVKLFLFTLDEAQKRGLLEFFFVALFSDSSNEVAFNCF
jgi:hypothetical protein